MPRPAQVDDLVLEVAQRADRLAQARPCLLASRRVLVDLEPAQ